MSLQPGINPLEAASMYGITGAMPGVIMGNRRMPTGTGEDTGHRSFPSAEELKRRMEQGIPNMGGFDPGDLMSRPEIRQEETRNQANMVSAPYEEANKMAAEKNNPMNAASQNPGKVFLMKFIGK
tara:strand:+ start:31 stop:405 length:375 start_codon:yes stop_codon:yes gene_type:complete